MLTTNLTTMLTDYALAAASLTFAVSLFRIATFRRQTSIHLWAIAFVFVAIAAVLGGTCHGLLHSLGHVLSDRLWQAMVYCLSFASSFMLAATVISSLPRRIHRWMLIAVVLKSILYLSWAGMQENFGYVIADYLSAMAIVLILQSQMICRHQKPGAAWIVAGILFSCVAVFIEWSRWSPTPYLSFNDFYHFVEIIALYLFYRGAGLLKDA